MSINWLDVVLAFLAGFAARAIVSVIDFSRPNPDSPEVRDRKQAIWRTQHEKRERIRNCGRNGHAFDGARCVGCGEVDGW